MVKRQISFGFHPRNATSSKNRKRRIIILATAIFSLILASLFLILYRRAGADVALAPSPTATVSETVTPSARLDQSGLAAETGQADIDISALSWPQSQTVNVPILMYHHIGPLPSGADDIRKGLTVSAEDFELQMQYLQTSNYQVVTLAQMYEAVAKDGPLQKTIVLTFDDGYSDNYEVAWPILARYGFKGTFFIISGKIGQSGYMNAAQINGLAQAGNEIGSHSVSHPDLANLSGAKVTPEVEKSKSDLGRITGGKIVSFCYPAGKFNSVVEKAVENAGYKIAVTTQKFKPFSTDKPFEVPRLRINPGANLKNLLK